jgi:hypothetical protein
MERLRGLSFRLAAYKTEIHGDHDHCSACWQKLMEKEWPGLQHEGYVTRYSIPNGSGDWQWNWVCSKCFSDLRETMQWTVEPRNEKLETRN